MNLQIILECIIAVCLVAKTIGDLLVVRAALFSVVSGWAVGGPGNFQKPVRCYSINITLINKPNTGVQFEIFRRSLLLKFDYLRLDSLNKKWEIDFV